MLASGGVVGRAGSPLVAAVRRELGELTHGRGGVRGSWEAQLALRLAAEVEDDATPLRDRVAAARGLSDVVGALRRAAPAPDEKQADRLDELAKARARRRAS